MADSSSLDKIFYPRPGQWGLRGDPYLWDEMALLFASLPVPETVEAFEQLFYEVFEQLTGVSAYSGKNILIDRFPSGGMSGGMVSTPFWRDTALPLLRERFMRMEK
ncbi:MAG: hypothetical protein R3C61_21260 [Bacteroidia bacterium]